ncbi:MAG TPA: hypothetical protein ENK64_01780 [Flavobacteriales bacterium]|nr:hypothetical protein [Flavobacteriales bacterium]
MNKLLSIFFLVSVFNLNAQQLVYDNLLKSTDLPDITFYDILEDDHHNIWLAAESGLYKYNGYDYIKYSNPNQINQAVFNLQTDQNGQIWCNNLYGQIFYIQNDRLKLFFYDPELTDNQFSNFKVFNQFVLLTANKGIFKIGLADKKVKPIVEDQIASSFIDMARTYFYTLKVPPSIEVLQNLETTEELFQLPLIKINATTFYPIDLHQILFTYKTNQSIFFYLINTSTNRFTLIKTPKKLQNISINNIINIDHKLWFATNNGVFVYQFNNQNLVFEKHIFKDYNVSKVLKDFNGHYWFTTLGNGILVIPDLYLEKRQFKNHNITTVLPVFDNNFVLGTSAGKLLFFNKTKLIDSLILPHQQNVTKLLWDTIKNRLLISTKSGSYQYHFDVKKLTDLDNKLAIAKSLQLISPNTFFYGNYKEGLIYKNDSLIKLRAKRVITSAQNDKYLYVAHPDGLFQYNKHDWTFEQIMNQNKPVLAKQLVYLNGNLYILTKNNGLLKYNHAQINQLSQFDHYKLQTINSDGQILWLKHQNGLLHFKPITKKIFNLYIKEVLSPYYQDIYFLKDYLITLSQNTLYFIPKTKSDLFQKNLISNTKISGLSINNIDTLLEDNLTLQYHQNNIKFTFNTTGYLSKQQTDYSYKLLPFDNDWQQINKGFNFVEFKELPVGDYTFKVRGKNNTSNKYSKVSQLSFTIKPRFWETKWFYGVVFLLITIIIYIVIKHRVKLDKQKRELKFKKLLTEKTMAGLKLENFRSQMNPHFIFNALNSIQDYIISNEKELASKYLVKFSRLIRIYLDHSQQNMVSVKQEITALKLYLELEKVRFDEAFTYQINIDENLPLDHIKIPSLFIQPYVENAIKHGLLHKKGHKNLNIDLSLENGLLQIIIEDNGVGRKRAQEIKKVSHKSFSTRANKERVKLYKNKLNLNINVLTEDLKDADNKASGTRVTIYISIQNKNYESYYN